MAFLLGVIGFALVTMPIYAVVARTRHDPNEISDRGGFILGGFVRSWFYWFIWPIERPALATRCRQSTFRWHSSRRGHSAQMSPGRRSQMRTRATLASRESPWAMRVRAEFSERAAATSSARV